MYCPAGVQKIFQTEKLLIGLIREKEGLRTAFLRVFNN